MHFNDITVEQTQAKSGLRELLPALDSDRSSQVDVDALANFIREVDGNQRLGAGALAERIGEWLAALRDA